VEALNNDPAIHGILVQLPLPAHIDAQKVIEAISPAKDVDGFHVASAGALMTGMPGFWPCTPYGCMKMLESIGYEPARQARRGHRPQQHRRQTHGADAAAGQRHRHHLPQRHASRPQGPDPQADVIVAAVGKRNVLTADMVKPGAVVLDVGMNRNDEGKLCGDVDFAACANRGQPHHPRARRRRAP
jgi:methylenetetrahydrofolate dehydrogenase (NADP+)/methenyltetrahydrofolate cyclohydrolase